MDSDAKLDLSKRYWVGHGTSIYHTFDTAAELNAWHDAQDTHGRYFCRLYDTAKNIDVLGSTYMFYDDAKRWKDEAAPKKRASTVDKLKVTPHERPAPVKAKASKDRGPER